MGEPRARDYERNEVAWWSNWADVTWFGRNAWLMTSRRFPEYFFNRGGFLECDGGLQRSRDIEKRMAILGRAPHFFVRESCAETVRLMLNSGYALADRMAVMSPGGARLHRNQEVVVEPARGSGLADWSKVYLLSFYGDLGLMAPVNEVVQALGHLRRKTLLIGRLEGRPAGVVALFRTPGVLGVYCVGTLPEFRGRGVAETLLESARRIGVSEDRRMVIQTIRSDGYEAYYLRRGFKTLYLKALLSKEKAGKGDSEG